MHSASVTCSKCKALLPTELFNQQELIDCPSCSAPTLAAVFPALFRESAVALPQKIVVEGEASCFYHPQKKAIVPCESCGRFLCALCDLDLNGKHLCPSCLDAGKKKGKLKSLENQRILYDRIALALAVFPLLFFWTSIIGAPMALYVAIRYWKEPCSIFSRSRATFIVAIVLASLEIVGWISFFIYIAST